jgi:amino acid adenylation domain-containing protein
MTYAELDRSTTFLAAHLQSHGVGPDSLVCLCFDRSLDMVVGLLGVLKAGGAYVPLDPAYPAERLAFILADARPKVLLTETALLDALSGLDFTDKDIEPPPIICLDQLVKTEANNLDVRPLNRRVRPDNLAYVIYTSGSTGKPKGVQVQHRSVVNFLDSMRRVPGLTADDILLAVTTLCFDIAGLEVFLPLTVGARVLIASREVTVDGIKLGRLLDESSVTVMQATPATWRLLIEAGWKGNRKLKILCGGEAWTRELAEALLARCGSLWNLYGPTETSIWSAVCEVTHGKPVLIGRPIANTQFYVLDKSLQPVPVGVSGELHIGGDGVARGYSNRPSLTDDKFVPNPFNRQPGTRMYKTGDLVRYRADGNIEYLGRIDHQVKVRGFRIELGEIESVLAAHPGVRENVVVVRQDRPDEKQLVAYWAAAAQSAPADTELRRHLSQKLPDYMVPSVFVSLPVLPRLPNGKIDRKALPAPDMNRGGKVFAAAVTAVQKALAETWKGILRVDQVGLYDSFFELGGHSLLAMQLVARVRRVFKVEVTLQQFFAAPTLIEMSQAIDSTEGPSETAKPPVPGSTSVGGPTEGESKKQGILPQVASRFPASALGGLEIDRSSITRVFPVSFAQQRLWFMEHLEPNTPVYNLAYAFRLRGSPNLQALRLSLQSILDRHEPLRSVFAMIGADSVQVIQHPCPLDVPLVDLSGLSASDQRAEVQKLAEAEARRPFNLSRDLMLRAKVLRLGAEEHLLLITMHHIVSDFWSVGILFREFAAAYEKYVKGLDGSLPAPVVQYADFAVWQRDWLRGEVLERQLSYWKQQLAGAPPLLALPTDRPRPALQTYAGAAVSLHLSGELRDSLQELSRREGVTLFMTMLAAFEVLLHRYTQQDDIVVGSPIAGRNEVETEGLIGFFVNTVLLRTDLSGDPSFKGLLGRVRDTALGAYAYQDLPFERLVEELQPERNLSYNPLCQVLFSFQNPAVTPLESAGVTLSLEPVSTGTSKTDLGLYITEQVDGVAIWAEYSTDLFESATISRLLEHYRTLLEAAVARPDVPVSRLSLLTGAERQQVLVDWNRTQIAYPKDRCLHELIEEQVERTPEAVAVVFKEDRLTYRQLNERANQLAHHLQKLGVRPGVLVGICMERSLELVIGLLGILKAGGAYVPLDPAYPAERLGLVIEDARMGVLVTQGKCLEKVAKLPAHVLDVDRDRITIGTEVRENLPKACRPEDLAYVIYTSGSTGRPKGVAIEHRSPVAFVAWAHTVFAAKELAGVLFSTSVCFDLSIFELFVALTQGGKVILAENALELAALGPGNEVTLVNTVPSAIAELVRTQRLPASVVTVNLAGEPLAASLVDKVYEQGSVQKVYDLYGPSETTTYSTFTLRSRGGRATIGRPIANTQIYLLDRQSQPVPIGVPAELHISGVGLARGYLNRPELTAEKFIPDPFSSEPGARLYKTGDLARYLPDGTIEYLGRIDHQVKVRGFRIELGEIESILAGHPAVREAVVVVREDGPVGKRLVAYVAPKDGPSMDVSELRNLVRNKLPDYMVPSAFVALEKLPLTPNGKVDRKALPSDGSLKVDEGRSWAPPADEAERDIARVWAQVLGLESVGRDSNFFDLGGHSLLLITARRRLEEIFDREVPTVEMFRHSTVRSLAKYLAGKELARAGSGAPRGRPTVDKDSKQRRREVRQRLRNS